MKGGEIKMRKTHEEFIEQLYRCNSHYRNGEFEVIGKYTRCHDYILCNCKRHGPWNSSTPFGLIQQNSGCPKCSKKATIDSMEYFLYLLKERNEHYINNEFTIESEFKGRNEDVTCNCFIHGIWHTKAVSLLCGHGCPVCGGTCKKTQEQFEFELKLKNEAYRNGKFTLLSKYVNYSEKIKCFCPIHGEFEKLPSVLLNGSGCNSCLMRNTSFSENYIRFALQMVMFDADIPERGERKTLKGREIDIPVYKYKLAVEFGSWDFHKNKWKADFNKQVELKKEKGIELITIYDQYDNSVVFPKDFNVWLYPKRLADENDYHTLKNIIWRLLPDAFKSSFENIDWEMVKEMSLLSTRTKGTEEFIRQLKKVNQGFADKKWEVVGEYLGSKIPIECKCKVHGHWDKATPNQLMRGSGCPCCGREKVAAKNSYSTEEFVLLLKMKNADFSTGKYVVIGEYTNSVTPIECACSIHGLWNSSIPRTLLRGGGCPKCGNKQKNMVRNLLARNKFLEKLWIRNEEYRKGKFTVDGDYINSKEPIRCICKIHGPWNSTPNRLLSGYGCTKCRGIRIGNTRRYTTEDFKIELSKKNEHYINGEFRVKGEYIASDIPILCECFVHGEWNTSTPANMLHKNSGCPICGRNEYLERQRKKHAKAFLEKLTTKNQFYAAGDFEIIGNYINENTPIACNCKIHGLWDTSTPKKLLNNQTCPKCRNKI